MHEYFDFTADIAKNGKLSAGEALQPTGTATTVRVRNGKISTTDGPFAETKEQLGGFYLIEAKDLNEAIQVASRIPTARFGSVEVRPIEDFSKERGECKASGADGECRDRRALPGRISAGPGHPHPPPRRFRSGRGGAAGRLRGGGGALAGGRGAANPRAWLVSTGRFKAIDRLRRRARFDASLASWPSVWATASPRRIELDDEGVDDDRLRLIFTCCHPALPPDAQIALTLREVCGLTTEEIARAFLIARAHPGAADRAGQGQDPGRKDSLSGPARADLPERLDTVLHVIYLVFNEGYSASSGATADPARPLGEAIRLGRLLVELLPEPEALGLLALMLLHESRRAARTTADGELVLLAEQDRSRWNREQIAEGVALVERALGSRQFGPYTLQAAIAALHAEAPAPEATDWEEIVGLYDVLLRAEPSPVVELNRAAAIAMRDGPARGLELIDEILGRGELARLCAWPTRRGRSCVGGWGERQKRSSPTERPSSSPGRSRSGGSSKGGWERLQVAISSPDL